MYRTSIAFILFGLFCSASAQTTPPSPGPSRGFVTVVQSAFHDGSGTPLRIQGINVCNKSKDEGFIGNLGRADFERIHSWGMNAVRLCIFWEGLEPSPGVFDDAYLNRIAGLVAEAKAEGLYVLLDMHQDLYSRKFGDGAPLWATLDEGKPQVQVSDWNDAYYVSPAVQTALDHFWADSKAPDGMGLQEHYARVWQLVARRFKDEPAVLGYDMMNEPFPGKDAGVLEYTMLARVSELLASKPGQPHPSVDDLLRMEGESAGRKQLTLWLADIDLYRGMLDAGAPIMQDFDRNRLMPMYERVRTAIRSEDRRHILFMEAAMSANLGVETAIAPLRDESGVRDPQQAYSPHVYDLVVDTDMFALYSNQRVDLIVDHHRSFAQRNRLPVLVGEWGAFYLDPAAAPATAEMKQRFAHDGFGDTYWAYRPEMSNWTGLNALKVPAATR